MVTKKAKQIAQNAAERLRTPWWWSAAREVPRPSAEPARSGQRSAVLDEPLDWRLPRPLPVALDIQDRATCRCVTGERRVSVVAGGTGAIGAAVVDVLARTDDVIVPSRHPESARVPAGVTVLRCDLSSEADVSWLADEVSARGPWRALAVAAGGYAGGAAHETDDRRMLQQLELNLLGPWRIARAAVGAMLAHGQGGRIVMVGSRASVRVEPGAAAYQVSKAALARLVEVMARELRGTGVTVNAVLPSTVDTAANRAAIKADASRWVPPAHIANAIAWLLSEDADSVSGALLPVYGDA
jgi:NAD(P)-dependent dehydrogenase (short-subunit alcohol dehydrogenase family)